MENPKKAVLLVGHGGLPRDIPSEIVEKFMRVHKTVCRQMNVDQSCKFLRDTYLPEGVFL